MVPVLFVLLSSNGMGQIVYVCPTSIPQKMVVIAVCQIVKVVLIQILALNVPKVIFYHITTILLRLPVVYFLDQSQAANLLSLEL